MPSSATSRVSAASVKFTAISFSSLTAEFFELKASGRAE